MAPLLGRFSGEKLVYSTLERLAVFVRAKRFSSLDEMLRLGLVVWLSLGLSLFWLSFYATHIQIVVV